jgi:hypothetical protein
MKSGENVDPAAMARFSKGIKRLCPILTEGASHVRKEIYIIDATYVGTSAEGENMGLTCSGVNVPQARKEKGMEYSHPEQRPIRATETRFIDSVSTSSSGCS